MTTTPSGTTWTSKPSEFDRSELDRKGMFESRIDADGKVRWRITAKGRAVRRAIRDGEAAWQEDSRYGLDS